MTPEETVQMLLVLSAIALIIGAAWHGPLGVVLFIAGFLIGWITSRIHARVRARRGVS